MKMEFVLLVILIKKKWDSTINWEEREKELIELCNKHRKSNGEYDCIVGGSGGKDSVFSITCS